MQYPLVSEKNREVLEGLLVFADALGPCPHDLRVEAAPREWESCLLTRSIPRRACVEIHLAHVSSSSMVAASSWLQCQCVAAKPLEDCTAGVWPASAGLDRLKLFTGLMGRRSTKGTSNINKANTHSLKFAPFRFNLEALLIRHFWTSFAGSLMRFF